ncbi:hypothetical protein F4212_06415 [Candidatus Poribacteria bacterium]|nr:hypothetical protein [Candidatus Poribacteria bacterium]
MKLYRRYIRYFVIGFILATLAFGSIGIQVIYSDTSPETAQCQKSNMPCPLDAAEQGTTQ